ncbi:hypothetical protein EW146_g7202 [Bondarzewia mesenterica]|uniref:HAD-like protein n=1 Tax=Bondarzewia mesenterica TaxID=1095465 RepID=A0A4S4LLG0_9AGAM|nr:hypothetical protein EW146_g7202 [Bondarzewia mesenterica]
MPSITVDAILFDMDGTLIDSTPGVLRAWDAFGRAYGFDGAAAAHDTHGRRLADTLAEWCKLGNDQEKLEAEIVHFENEVIQGGPVVLPGVLDLLEQINAGSSPSAYGWTIITSGMYIPSPLHLLSSSSPDLAIPTKVFTPKALAICNVPIPAAGYVTSNDIKNGKPHPDPFLAGAKQCGVDPTRCAYLVPFIDRILGRLVVEDAPSGLKAGRAAGAQTLAVCTSHTREKIEASGANPDFIVKDLTRVLAKWVDGKLVVDIDEATSDQPCSTNGIC